MFASGGKVRFERRRYDNAWWLYILEVHSKRALGQRRLGRRRAANLLVALTEPSAN